MRTYRIEGVDEADIELAEAVLTTPTAEWRSPDTCGESTG